MNWEQLQAALKEAKAAGDTDKVEQLLTDYAAGQNTKIEGLNGEAKNHRLKASERQAIIDKFGGLDPDAVQKLQSDAATAEENRLKQAGQFDELKANLTTQHTAALEASNKAGQGWKSKFEGLAIKQPVIEAGVAMNAVAPNEVAQLLNGRVKMNDEGVAVVYDEAGNPAFNKDDGKPETIKGLVTGFLQANPHHVKAGSGGSGSSNGGEGGGDKTVVSQSEISNNLEAVAKGEVTVQT